MNLEIKVTTIHNTSDDDDTPQTPQERLELVERLRLEAGKFIYDYPTRLRRVITVVRKK